MDMSHLSVVIWFVISPTTNVLAADSTLLWALSNDTLSCLASVLGDPVEWVSALTNDPDYGITPELYCLEESTFPRGPLAFNPSVPDVIITADLEDDQLISYGITPDSVADSYFGGAVGVTGIAIDYQSQNIYFTVPTRIVIIQFGRSRPYYNVLIEDRNNASQIVVDPDSGYIFWAESTGLRRASLTGEQLTELGSEVSKDVLLTIDTVDQRIFVLEGNYLKVLDYDGDIKNTYVVPEILAGITYDQQYIFGTTASYPNIMIIKATSGEVMANVSFESDFTQGDITTRLAESKQPTGPCATDNGRCSHICIHVSKDERKCTCGLGFVLQDDGSSCKPKYLTDNFVLLTDIGTNAIYQIDTTSAQISGIPIERIINQFTESVAYDPVAQQVIWMDTGNGTLRSLVLTEDSTERILYTFDNDSFISDIAYDHINAVVYYADYDLSEIGRVYMSGAHDVLLSTVSQGKPVQIALDIIGRYVYWSSKGEPSQILRARIPDGSGMTTIIGQGLVYPSGLALNVPDSLLYWVDSDGNKLEKANEDGSGRVTLAETQDESTLALDNDYLYMLRTHDISRYALSDMQKSAFSIDIFSLLDGISLYSSNTSQQTTTMTTTATTITTIKTTTTTTAKTTKKTGYLRNASPPASSSSSWTSINPRTTTPATDEQSNLTSLTTETSQSQGSRSGVSVATGLALPIWGIIWLHHFIG